MSRADDLQAALAARRAARTATANARAESQAIIANLPAQAAANAAANSNPAFRALHQVHSEQIAKLAEQIERLAAALNIE